jgi:acyl-CoA reductase-like NAD-dependent aldehyde dehydrogenase
VVIAISPFNSPLNLAAYEVAPALAVGTTVVLKPATVTPLIPCDFRGGFTGGRAAGRCAEHYSPRWSDCRRSTGHRPPTRKGDFYRQPTGWAAHHGRDIQEARQAIKRLDFGGMIINDVPTFRADHMPHGGVKESGIGREGVGHALEEMAHVKMVAFNLD